MVAPSGLGDSDAFGVNVANLATLRTFNLGVGLVCVCAADFAAELSNQLTEVGTRTRFVGEVQDGSGQARTMDSLSW